MHERVEYRVTGIDFGSPPEGCKEVDYEGDVLDYARESYELLRAADPKFDRVLFESRTITTGPWKSVPSALRKGSHNG